MKRSIKAGKLPPIRAYVERVDDAWLAVVAHCFRIGQRRFYDDKVRRKVIRPVLYGMSVFTLVNSPYVNRAIAVGVERLHGLIQARGGQLPFMGICSELPGWGDRE